MQPLMSLLASRWRSLTACALAAVLTYFGIGRAVPPFASQTVVMLQEGRGIAGLAAQGLGVAALFGGVGGGSNLRMLKQVVLSDDTVREVDQELGFIAYFKREGNLYEDFLADPADPERRLALLKHVVDIQIDDRANLMTITARGYEPAFANKLAARLVAVAQQRMNQMAQHTAQDQIQFMEEETRRLARKDADSQHKLQEYQARTGMTAAEIGVAVGSGGLPQVTPEAMLLWQQKLAELQVKRSGLRQFLREDAPEVQLVDAEIKAVQAQIRNRKQELLPKGDKNNVAQARLEFANLLYEAALNKEMYLGAARATTQARAEAASTLKRVDMVQSPTLPTRPQRGSTLLHIALALLVAGLLWIFIGQIKRYVHSHID